jgi:hypothetical protein
MVGFLVLPAVELATSEFGRVMVNGFFWVKFCIAAIEKNRMQMLQRSFWDFFANFDIFPGEIVKSCHVQILHT